MEAVIKAADGSREAAYNSGRRYFEEYKPLKEEIDRLRQECLGLDKLPDLNDDDQALLSSE